jgi:chromosome segregation ATPase
LRKKVKRGQLQAVRDNTGRLLVWVDPPAEPGQVSSRPAVVQAGQVDALASQESALVQSLRDHIETLKGLLIAEVERTQIARDEVQEARADADHAKADQVRMARDVSMMFDELKALADRHAEMHSDRARLQADVERLAAELEQARRPWWRRLVGR